MQVRQQVQQCLISKIVMAVRQDGIYSACWTPAATQCIFHMPACMSNGTDGLARKMEQRDADGKRCMTVDVK